MLSSRTVPLGIDSQLYPSKTPARVKGRPENAVPTTVHGIGKGKEAALRTAFHAGPQYTQKDAVISQTQGKPIMVTSRSNARPLGDKTPFPNRVRNAEQFGTPLAKLSKFPILSLLEPQTHLHPQKTPDSLLRPSTARKHIRVPRSASKSFETPLNNNGNHWDVSELSIVAPEVQVQELLPEDDYDEIEYMPLNTIDVAYQPPFDFDLPDYKEVGKTLLELSRSYPYDDIPIAEIEMNREDLWLSGWDMLPLQALESDDPFHQAAGPKDTVIYPSSKSVPTISRIRAATNRLPTASKPTPVSRPAPAERVPSAAASRPIKPMHSRPGTSHSTAPPTKPPPRTNTAKNTAPSTTWAPSQKPGAIDLSNATSVSRRAKPSVRSINPIPSRPATSVAMRSRVASTVATTASVRRPATSTASYKSTPAVGAPLSRPVPSKLAPAGREPLGVLAKDRDAQSNGMVLVVGGEVEPDDDFRFDV